MNGFQNETITSASIKKRSVQSFHLRKRWPLWACVCSLVFTNTN